MKINQVTAFQPLSNQKKNHPNTISITKEQNGVKIKDSISQDELQLSEEGRTLQQETSVALQTSDALHSMLETLAEQGQNAKDSDDSAKDLAKIMEIARRIARGDRVPAKDERKLMEYNKDLYMSSKQAAMLAKNKHPKKYKSMYEDEDDQDMESKLRALDQESSHSIEADGSPSSSNIQPEETADDISSNL